MLSLSAKKTLLILGPSFRRVKSNNPLPALERYDGIFFRVTRKYCSSIQRLDIAVMTDNFTLVNASTSLGYTEPEGTQWGNKTISNEILENAKSINEVFLEKKFKKGKYQEVFISMGKEYAKALPDLSRHNVKVIFPSTGGPGPKAQALKNWLNQQ
jgi:hypothetical protein